MSNRTEMASPKTLREWCRCTCANYPDVEIRNMSTSFRDGLAFCAIIHKHRPDLIDFSSLSKDNVYQNNKLAFETAERKLGLPALLDPKDLVSNKVPDSLSVITYISQYYHFFNRKSYAGLPSLKSPHVTFLNNLTKSKTPDGLKPLKNPTDLETGREDRLSNTRPCTVCSLCFNSVHLIQRHLMDGKVFHRSCFRCKVCHSTLLPGSYTLRSEDGSLICSHHITDSPSVELNQQVTPPEILPKCKFQEGYVSLGGLAVTSVPYYGKKTESADRLVFKTPEMEGKEKQERSSRDSADGVKSVEKKPAPPLLPPPIVKGGTGEGGGAAPILAEDERQQEATHSSELSTPCIRVTEEGSSRPVPAPRRMLDSVPVPAPRIKTAPTTKSASAAAGNSSIPNKCSPNSSHISSPSRGNPKVQSNHPWITIVHPGPWTQLPPAPPPVPTPRSKSGFNQRRTWYKPQVPAPNPFGEEEGEEEGEEDPKEEEGAKPQAVEQAGDTSQLSLSDLDETGKTGGSPLDVTEAEAAGTNAISEETQSHILPRSLSVPAITSARSQSSLSSFDLTEETESDQVMSSSSKVACKENPFDRKPGIPKSKTFQTLQSARAPAPGHGFPLIKRKVQTDQNASSADLQLEMSELDKHLEDLEQRGVELERNLRDYKNDKEEEQMLMEWFSLNHERHVLVHRGTELFYLTKQQKLEERQADVEYELRCLLNKPESDWSEEDRGLEGQLMDELVAVIEQRNQIVGSLDQDRQRESEEDMHLEAMRKNKDFQKEGLKDLKKSKGKFKPAKMFKMLNHKAESNKDSVDKKS
ncbi:MICAL-like protein 1 isoform X1 [Trematomus bernacchii]|uniref:MICAL-like protein 1 isoform X1 n=1 Tax=Trematomus bernacchii TaxID=40690 RepID=UPI00146D0FA5|nr:MICAL-like protein 1 isoform X1 [Trematomus bernacchii]